MPADLSSARARLTQQRNDLLSQPFMPTRTSMDSPWTTREGALQSIDARLADLDRLERSRNSHNRLVNIGRVASVAPFALAGGAALLGGGAAAPAASGTSFWGGVTAPTFGASTAAGAGVAGSTAAGAGMTFGNLLKLGELGTGIVTNLFGNRSNNRALDRDSMLRQNEFAQQMALLQQQNQQAQRQWEAEQAQRAQEFAMAAEDRTRRNALEDAREGRRTTYRTTIGDPALLRMRDILRLGR